MLRDCVIWGALFLVCAVPVGLAATSPFLAWRDPVYIVAGFAGIMGLCLMLLQPLLATGRLPGLNTRRSRRLHRWVGAGLLAAILVHVIGLWITSPPDVIDALLFQSPTLFSAWGVSAMWAVALAACFALVRPHLSWRVWRIGHIGLVAIAMIGTIVHTLLIEGTMEVISKVVLCAAVLLVTVRAVFGLRFWRQSPKAFLTRKARTAQNSTQR